MRLLPSEQDWDRIRRYREHHTVVWLSTLVVVVVIFVVIGLLQQG